MLSTMCEQRNDFVCIAPTLYALNFVYINFIKPYLYLLLSAINKFLFCNYLAVIVVRANITDDRVYLE